MRCGGGGGVRGGHGRVGHDGPEGGLRLLLLGLGLHGGCLSACGGLLLELPDGGVDEHVEAAEGLAVRLGRRRRRRHAAAPVQLARAAVHWACLRGRENEGGFEKMLQF